MPKMSHPHTARPTHKRPPLSQRRSAPTMQEGWEDVFDRGGNGLGKESPALNERRKTSHGTPRSARSSHGPGMNPFDAEFRRAAGKAGVGTKPCRTANPQPGKAKSEKAEKSGWAEVKEFCAHILALVVEDYLKVMFASEWFKKAQGCAGAYASRAGAHMGGAAGGPAGAAMG